MRLRTAGLARALICTALGCSVALSLYLARTAYLGSREVGGGAAQGDLGFFMMLVVISPPIVLGTVLFWWLDGQTRPRWRLLPTPSVRVSCMACASLLVLGWDWLYLFEFWRA